ncbi:hypothetical protein FLA_3963 [Filimonas lacunae]|nr:hypothetical protein FLA_3963 [Filimonas lacunae]
MSKLMTIVLSDRPPVFSEIQACLFVTQIIFASCTLYQ